jgi:hypothetical protein
MLSRRELIGKAAVGAAAALAVGGVVGTGIAATRPLRDATDDSADDRDGQHAATHETAGELDAGVTSPSDAIAPPPWNLLRPLAAGSALAHGWRIVDLTPVRNGSTVATLQNARGRSHRVHLCRNDGSPQGLVHTRRMDLVVMNEGHGELPTEERLAQAVAALAHAIAANESTVADGLFDALMPHAERVQRYAAAGDISVDGKLR